MRIIECVSDFLSSDLSNATFQVMECLSSTIYLIDGSRFFLSSSRRHTSCAIVTGVQTCALPISIDLKYSCGRSFKAPALSSMYMTQYAFLLPLWYFGGDPSDTASALYLAGGSTA